MTSVLREAKRKRRKSRLALVQLPFLSFEDTLPLAVQAPAAALLFPLWKAQAIVSYLSFTASGSRRYKNMMNRKLFAGCVPSHLLNIRPAQHGPSRNLRLA